MCNQYYYFDLPKFRVGWASATKAMTSALIFLICTKKGNWDITDFFLCNMMTLRLLHPMANKSLTFLNFINKTYVQFFVF